MKPQRPVMLMLCALLPIGTALTAVRASAQSHHNGHHSAQDVAAWAKKFDDPTRDASQKPAEVIQALQLKLDTVVPTSAQEQAISRPDSRTRYLLQGRVYAFDA